MSDNLGHRLGDYAAKSPVFPENSLGNLEYAWSYQEDRDFDYWELDIVTTKDDQLCIIHDRETADGMAVYDQTMDEIKEKEPWRVTLQEFFQKVYELDKDIHSGLELKADICVELKRLYTEKTKAMFIQAMVDGRELLGYKVEIQSICFNKPEWRGVNHFDDIFETSENKDLSRPRFAENELNVLEVGNHDTCCFNLPIYETKGNIPEPVDPPVEPVDPPVEPVDPPVEPIDFWQVGKEYSIMSDGINFEGILKSINHMEILLEVSKKITLINRVRITYAYILEGSSFR